MKLDKDVYRTMKRRKNVLSKRLCKRCKTGPRIVYPDGWVEDDEAEWKAQAVWCPTELVRVSNAGKAVKKWPIRSTYDMPPIWCPYAAEHIACWAARQAKKSAKESPD